MSNSTPVFAASQRHPNPFRLWTANIGGPLRYTGKDARLPDPGKGDTTFGQDFWHAAVEFSNIRDLASKLTTDAYTVPEFLCGNWFFDCGPIDPFQLEALAILAHGGPGLLDINGKAVSASAANAPELHDNPDFLSVKTLKEGRYDDEIKQIGTRLQDNSIVYLMACRVAAEAHGEEFLKLLSERWTRSRIVAISSIGYCSTRQKRLGSQGSDNFPGMRDTQYPNHKVEGMPARDYESNDVWNDLNRLPWVSERAPHAKVAFNGVLITNRPEPAPVF